VGIFTPHFPSYSSDIHANSVIPAAFGRNLLNCHPEHPRRICAQPPSPWIHRNTRPDPISHPQAPSLSQKSPTKSPEHPLPTNQNFINKNSVHYSIGWVAWPNPRIVARESKRRRPDQRLGQSYTTHYETKSKNVSEHICPAPLMRPLKLVSINRSLPTGSTTLGMNDRS
jgi:hypothetical protein